jgi:hypothetical protein
VRQPILPLRPLDQERRTTLRHRPSRLRVLLFPMRKHGCHVGPLRRRMETPRWFRQPAFH